MQGKEKAKTPREAYKERLGRLSDEQLKREWDMVSEASYDYIIAPQHTADIKHEMALRFLGQSESQEYRQDARAYFWDKLLQAAQGFGRLVAAGEFFRAKYLYEQACMLAVFLETPVELRQELFGTTKDDGVYVDGLFDKKGVNAVMSKCVVWNRLGYDCMVYRIPGEVGYHGARPAPGLRPDRRMEKEENPAYLQEAVGQ